MREVVGLASTGSVSTRRKFNQIVQSAQIYLKVCPVRPVKRFGAQMTKWSGDLSNAVIGGLTRNHDVVGVTFFDPRGGDSNKAPLFPQLVEIR